MNTAMTTKLAIAASALLMTSTMALAQEGDSLSRDFGYDPLAAEKSRVRHESTGLIGGLVLGGIIAGPPGAIFSATAGALFGNHLSATEEKQQMQASLQNAKAEYLALEQDKRALERRYQLAMEELQNSRFRPAALTATPASIAPADSALAIHFRTNSTMIEPHYREQLEEFSRLVKSVPQATVQITGYSDIRGDNDSNLTLSERRVQGVAAMLISLNIDTSIQTVAYGESRPLANTDSVDGYFYDRRVEIRILTGNNDLITSTADQ